MVPGDHPSAAAPMRPSQSRVQRWRCRAKALTFRLLVWELRGILPQAARTRPPRHARPQQGKRHGHRQCSRRPATGTVDAAVRRSEPTRLGVLTETGDPPHIRTGGAALGVSPSPTRKWPRNLAQRGCGSCVARNGAPDVIICVSRLASTRDAYRPRRRAEPESGPCRRNPVVPRQPNIVLILTDDEDLAIHQFMPKTKALLEDHGTRFDNFFVTYSFCCPSRASILRGQYAHNTHIVGNEQPWGGFESSASWGSRNRPWPPGCRAPAITPR